ncbi:MAG: hypothetical protein F6K26_01450 [Moorea sp. SIO2I5]|nr:hypothetical protein [Moorena sp. SIO2I5]
MPIAYCLLPIAYCLLPIAYCLLPIAYCLLPNRLGKIDSRLMFLGRLVTVGKNPCSGREIISNFSSGT